jgi:hypothetical protein
MGLASLTAFVGPAFFVFPVAAVGIGLLALARIRDSDGALTGAGLARRGMALAIAFTVAAVVRNDVRDRLLERQASEAARQWVELLSEGRIDDAREWLSSDGAGSLAPSQMSETPPPPGQRESIVLEKLRGDDLTHAASGKPVSVDSSGEPTYEGPRIVVNSTLVIGDPAGDHRHALVQMSRYPAYERTVSPWHVDRWSLQSDD